MGAMGRSVPTMVGVGQADLVSKIQKIVPDYMAMGEHGMAEMGAMEMPLPDNTHPMMTGTGPFGPLEMGGMFTTLKVRANQPAGDYSDPGHFNQPPGTRAYEWQGAPANTPRPARADAPGTAPGAAHARKPSAGAHPH